MESNRTPCSTHPLVVQSSGNQTNSNANNSDNPVSSKIAPHMHKLLLCFLLFIGFTEVCAQDSDTLLIDPLIGTSIDQKKRKPTSLENAGKMINSEFDDSAPVISLDGNTLFFWSTRPEGYGFQDIYITEYDSSFGNWKFAKNIGSSLNNAGANIVLSITPDGRMLLIYRENRKADSLGYSDLAIVRKSYDGWSLPVQIKVDQFKSESGSALTAYLGADGKTLVMSMQNAESKGSEDLYISFVDKDTKAFSKPRNLGNINSTGADITPFLAPDNITIYFSSNRPGGSGGLDVYMTQRLDSTWQNWTPPVNLGKMVNTDGDDFHFKFPAAADFAYMVSTGRADTNYGGRDIYSIPIPPDFKPQPVAVVKGTVIDRASETKLGADIAYIRLSDGKYMGKAHSDPETGEYRVILPTGGIFAILAEGEGYIAISENLDTRNFSAYTEVVRNLYLAPMEVGEIIQMNNLFFELGSSKLQPESYPEIKRLALMLKSHPTLEIEVVGHTDNIGDEAFNRQLSLLRSQEVIKVLSNIGVDNNRITAIGYGSTQPSDTNDTPEGRHNNRRVEFVILAF